MTTDSSGEGVTPAEQPLFRFGDPAERYESVVHSLLLIVVAFLVSGVVVGVGNGLLEASGLSTPITTELVPTALHFAAFIAVSVLYLELRNDRSLIGLSVPDRRDLAVGVLGTGVLVGTMLASQYVLSAYGVEIAENTAVESGRSNPELFLYYIPLVLFLNVPGEELLFRGVVQGLFRRAYGVVPGILAAGAIFGAIHYVALLNQGSAMAYVAIAVLSGIILGAVYEYTGNILVPIAVHAVWNIFVYLNLYAETGGTF